MPGNLHISISDWSAPGLFLRVTCHSHASHLMMTSSCVPHLGPGDGDKRRGSEEYTLTNIEAASKRGNKNLFKTALEKLSRKYRKHKKISDNLYEVIVVYKDSEELEAEAETQPRSLTRSEPTKRKIRNGPIPPPRTRSR